MAVMFGDYLLDSDRAITNDNTEVEFGDVYVCDVVNVGDTEAVMFTDVINDLVNVPDFVSAVSSEETISEATSGTISEATSDWAMRPGGHFRECPVAAGGAHGLRRIVWSGPQGPFEGVH